MVGSRQGYYWLVRKRSWSLVHLRSRRRFKILTKTRHGLDLSRASSRGGWLRVLCETTIGHSVLSSVCSPLLCIRSMICVTDRGMGGQYSNYCGEFDNAGAMMSVDETLLCSFQVSLPVSLLLSPRQSLIKCSRCRFSNQQRRRRRSHTVEVDKVDP